jgi:hypothetical protein
LSPRALDFDGKTFGGLLFLYGKRLRPVCWQVIDRDWGLGSRIETVTDGDIDFSSVWSANFLGIVVEERQGELQNRVSDSIRMQIHSMY